MATGVDELLDMLFEMIDEAKSMPLSSDKCILERDRALDLLDEIRAQFPMELAEAKKLIAARTEYIASAKREGELIRKQAEEKAEAGKPVLEAVKNVLGDQVKEVRISKILKSGACCLSADGPVSLEMERYMRKLEGGEHMKAQRVLELNADSAPYAALKKAVDAGDQSTVEKYSKLLYGQALLLADLPLEDPAGYAELVCSLMV